MNITTSELVYINEAAKALKQKDFILIDNAIIGLDNIENLVTFILLDNNFLTNYFHGIIINQRALSAFIKTISIESDFQFDSMNTVIQTKSGGELFIGFDQRIAELACSRYKIAISIDTSYLNPVPEKEAPNITEAIQNMSKADGAIRVNYYNYFMTLFPSILPLTKSDKMYISIYEKYFSLRLFTAKFRIHKKKFDVITYIHYYNIA
jgi:hypothetical protein